MPRRDAKEFSSLLLQWRTKHGWSREEAAVQLGVSYRTLQEWEQGRRAPTEMARRGVLASIREIEK